MSSINAGSQGKNRACSVQRLNLAFLIKAKDQCFIRWIQIKADNIFKFFKKKIDLAIRKGIKKEHIIIDPGIGFGKNREENLEIIASLGKLKKLRSLILLGISRKSFLADKDGNPGSEGRLLGSLAATTIGVLNGADIIRTHDVADTLEVVKLAEVIRRVKNK